MPEYQTFAGIVIKVISRLNWVEHRKERAED